MSVDFVKASPLSRAINAGEEWCVMDQGRYNPASSAVSSGSDIASMFLPIG
jgi:hypothetical protein